MEPITLTAAAIATLFFSEAAKESGKSFGAGASNLVSQLITAVQNKLKAAGTDGLLRRAEKQPTEANVNLVKAELEAQMEEDKEFYTQLNSLLTQLEASGFVRQVMGSGIKIAGNLEAESMTQKANRGGSVEQEMLTDITAQNIKLGISSQES